MKKNLIKKTLAVVMTVALLTTFVPLIGGAATEVDYTVVNPYADVNWNTWGQYKANLHTHSTVSDGKDDLGVMVEKHYELGYDILAMTDHGTIDRSWTDVNIIPGLNLFMNLDTFGAKSKGLTDARFTEITNGVGRDGRGLLRVPLGIEHNAAALNNTHVNSFFCDFGDGYIGGTSYYDHILKGVQDAGGISVINHPGEYTGARKASTEEAYDTSDPHYNYIIKKFTTLFNDFESCLGMEVINKNDSRTKNDRKLWDLLLANVTAPGRSLLGNGSPGRNIFGFGNSDAHNLGATDTNWNIMVMPANTTTNLRTCLENGAFFAASHNIKNPMEIDRLEAETGLTLGDNEWDADRTLAAPRVTSIAVDNTQDSISLTALNQETIHWIADGEVIHVGGTLNLDDHTGSLGTYVRAEIWGEGGILYSQPFILEYKDAPTQKFFVFYDFGRILNYFENVFYYIVEKSVILSALQGLALGN
ncbi:MAG TPA: hypothetical protein VFD23_05505 [Clostridia bacterium]|nr:hypothetical protein [Clostridia bacterium]